MDISCTAVCLVSVSIGMRGHGSWCMGELFIGLMKLTTGLGGVGYDLNITIRPFLLICNTVVV